MKTRSRTGRLFLYIAAILVGLLFALPFLYTIYTSLVPMRYVNKLVSPEFWTFDNYKMFFTMKRMMSQDGSSIRSL